MTQLVLKLTLADDTSRSGPALVHFHDDPRTDFSWLFLAWSGTGNELINLMHVDPLTGLVSKFTSMTAHGSPCLCAHNGRVVIAWCGPGSPGQLNVSPISVGLSEQGPFDRPQLRLFDEARVTLAETSTDSPAISSHGGQLFIAWIGVGNSRINLKVSVDNGAHFRGKITLPDTAIGRPFITSHGNRLFIAWTGSDHRLNFARVSLSRIAAHHGGVSHYRINGLSQQITLEETSNSAPALASYGGQLIIGWTEVGEERLSFLFSRDMGASFHGKFTPPERARGAPILASGGGRLYVSWTGVDPEGHLNLAVLDPS